MSFIFLAFCSLNVFVLHRKKLTKVNKVVHQAELKVKTLLPSCDVPGGIVQTKKNKKRSHKSHAKSRKTTPKKKKRIKKRNAKISLIQHAKKQLSFDLHDAALKNCHMPVVDTVAWLAQLEENLRAEIKEDLRAEIKEDLRAEIEEDLRAEIEKNIRAEIEDANIVLPHWFHKLHQSNKIFCVSRYHNLIHCKLLL